jgi:hypothetical protein
MPVHMLGVAERIDGIGICDIDLEAYERRKIRSVYHKAAMVRDAMKLWYENEIVLQIKPSKNQEFLPGHLGWLTAFESWFAELPADTVAVMHRKDVRSITVTGAVFSGSHPRIVNPAKADDWLDYALYATSDKPLVQLRGLARFPDYHDQSAWLKADFLMINEAPEAPTSPLINLVHVDQL